jgi:hypothetical protein
VIGGHRADCIQRPLQIALLAALICALVLVSPVRALADGDPASDYLVLQRAFVPADAGFSPTQQVQLNDLLAASKQHGYPLRVAVIASPGDLGSVGAAWLHPQAYAEFLAAELSLTYRGQLLVVMPNGFGSARPGSSRVPPAPTVAAPGRTRLAVGALAAVDQLLNTHYVPLSAVAVVALPRSSGNGGPIPSLAFLIGLALVLAAWTVSLRRRPLYS